MKLLLAYASPYTRLVRIALLETGLDARVVKQEVTLRDPASALLPFNPVGRVPTLRLDDGTVLSESLLILQYIDTQHDGRKLLPQDGSDGWRTLAGLGTATGLLDGIVTWARELRRPEGTQSKAVLDLEVARVNRTADALEQAVAAGDWDGPLDAAAIALGCALGWCAPRHPAWRWQTGRPALTSWFDRIDARPSFQATLPPPL